MQRIYAKTLLVVACLWSVMSLRAADKPIDNQNWQHHPRIEEIRAIYNDVRNAIAAKKLKRTRREFEDCEPYQDAQRIAYMDAKGVIRNYYTEAGSDDSIVPRDFYYDQQGRLRFAFIRGGAVNGTRIEHRIYFDETGKRLWEIQTLVEGPGYTFPRDVWPEDDIVRDPKRELNSPNVCREIAR